MCTMYSILNLNQQSKFSNLNLAKLYSRELGTKSSKMYHPGGVSGVHVRNLPYFVLHTDFMLSKVRIRGCRPCGLKYADLGQLQNPTKNKKFWTKTGDIIPSFGPKFLMGQLQNPKNKDLDQNWGDSPQLPAVPIWRFSH